ncbi:hypothetical protein STCU_11708 [Strigomonas culicis]|uniref:Uncharacterized protein n=1 Tax=Strigomonas culicis TaxID=28005 RepID=S9TFX8_9TRYP|nr:hypothetical protein STCU_11708 [Strigomonas culicis]|eukprot:EPY15864.1 hypothetical protein STCU_11708 [Strigomonas culicis]
MASRNRDPPAQRAPRRTNSQGSMSSYSRNHVQGDDAPRWPGEGGGLSRQRSSGGLNGRRRSSSSIRYVDLEASGGGDDWEYAM